MLGPMRAVVITRPGGPEVLDLAEVPDPIPGPGELLVRVRAAALNRADLLQRRGLYPAPAGVPEKIPGLEFAGEVEACDSRAEGFRPGDRVMGILGGGGQAERVTLHHRLCMAVPASLTWEQAASIPETFLTAYDALYLRGRLAAGENVLIQAAGSGVGIAAFQLTRAGGANAIGLARTAEKRRRLEAGGLAPVMDPADRNAAKQIVRAAAGRGVDLILDLVGAGAWPLHARVLRERGRVVVIGLLSGSRCEIDLGLLMRKRATLTGSVLRSRPLEEKAALTHEFAGRMLPLFSRGDLRTWIDRSLPLHQVNEAHALMERNENLGKIVLTLEDD
jgi:putative PIG3 family NAD(P)H quinone oxidoreductase